MTAQDKDRNIELLSLYYEEWRFRQDGLWKRIVQFFVIIFFTSTLPITVNIFHSISIPNISLLVFPIVGIFLTAFFVVFCMSESVRIKAIDMKIKKIISDCFDPSYCKMDLPSLFDNTKPAGKIFTKRMAIWVPLSLATMQLILAGFMIWLILSGKL